MWGIWGLQIVALRPTAYMLSLILATTYLLFASPIWLTGVPLGFNFITASCLSAFLLFINLSQWDSSRVSAFCITSIRSSLFVAFCSALFVVISFASAQLSVLVYALYRLRKYVNHCSRSIHDALLSLRETSVSRWWSNTFVSLSATLASTKSIVLGI